MNEIDQYSACTYKLILKYEDQILGTATGFVVDYARDRYLVSNWHVFSGRKPFDNQPIHKMGSVPNKLDLHFLDSNLDLTNPQQMDIALVDNEWQNLWHEHPDGGKIDVAVVKLNEEQSSLLTPIEMSDTHHFFRMIPEIGMSVAIIGYPYGDKGLSSVLPIWKSGTIASEPNLEYSKTIKALLVDATTRPGMSGSPVLVRSSGPFNTVDGKKFVGGNIKTKFLGIYSGRMNYQVDDESNLSSEIGIVWRPEKIIEVLKDIRK